MEEINVHVVKYPDRDNLVMRYVDPFTRRQVQRSTGTTNPKEAEREAAKWESDLRNGRYKSPSRVTWEEFRDKYENEVVTGLAKNTDSKISSVFDSVETIINPERVRDITSERLSFYVAKQRKNELAESTIASYIAHLRAALAYAVEWGYLAQLPDLPRQQRAKTSKVMKGRPITGEEFDRMISSTVSVVGKDASPSWEWLLRGLWLSGLRLSESLSLRWDDGAGAIVVDMSGRRPMFRIPAEAHKSNRDVLLPMAPEFAEMLETVAHGAREGLVFPLAYRRKGRGDAIQMEWASATISAIGSKAGVKVNPETGKTASAHDLRRSFGQRWSTRVMPAVLQQLMRHADINTTLKFYVGQDAEATADVLWDAVGKLGTKSGTIRRKKSKKKLGN